MREPVLDEEINQLTFLDKTSPYDSNRPNAGHLNSMNAKRGYVREAKHRKWPPFGFEATL